MNLKDKIEKKINIIIKDSLIIKKKINNNTDLISNGLLDSVNIFLLINELEKDFKIKISIKNFDINNFRSKKKIINYLIKSKKIKT
jgi:acyl carrier protein|tara:strand:+ start:45 stop:302 length:258 start_codon:yes stop_codon:yes gene_type:complete